MAKITERLGIDKRVTTLVSRHTFSTQMKKAGASTEYIQETLGIPTNVQQRIIWTASIMKLKRALH